MQKFISSSPAETEQIAAEEMGRVRAIPTRMDTRMPIQKG